MRRQLSSHFYSGKVPLSCSTMVQPDRTASCTYPPDDRPWPNSIKTLPCRATWNSLQPGHLQTSLDRQGWCADSTCTTFSYLFFSILFDSINHSHVHMYISHWGPEEQSPSLEINFDSTILHACVPPIQLEKVPTQQRRWKPVSQHRHWACSLCPVLVLVHATDLAIP